MSLLTSSNHNQMVVSNYYKSDEECDEDKKNNKRKYNQTSLKGEDEDQIDSKKIKPTIKIFPSVQIDYNGIMISESIKREIEKVDRHMCMFTGLPRIAMKKLNFRLDCYYLYYSWYHVDDKYIFCTKLLEHAKKNDSIMDFMFNPTSNFSLDEQRVLNDTPTSNVKKNDDLLKPGIVLIIKID